MTDEEVLTFLWDLPYTCEVDVVLKYGSIYNNLSSGVTLACLGRIMGVSRERIRQIQEKALQKLRKRTHWKKYQGWIEHISESYGECKDFYGQYLPDMIGVATETKAGAGNSRWEKLYGNCQKPRVRK